MIAVSGKNLMRQVEKRKFRKDLYNRLDVISLVIPPLREVEDLTDRMPPAGEKWDEEQKKEQVT